MVAEPGQDTGRAVWHIIASMEQPGRTWDGEQQGAHAREYAAKVEAALQRICDGILALIDLKVGGTWCCGPETGSANVVTGETQGALNDFLVTCLSRKLRTELPKLRD